MKEKTNYVIGLMSGTSLDGLDLVYVRFVDNEKLSFKIIHAETVAYTPEWKSDLQHAITFTNEKLANLHIAYGKLLGDLTNDFISRNDISDVDFIASHGHTVFHEPEKGYTLQIGCGETLSKITKHQVVYDFRTQDVALGGQGAPLVPIGDALLFAKYDYCLNLGGFANVSTMRNGNRIAYDICPVNIVMNHYTQLMGLPFDDGGKIAASGVLNDGLLSKLNALPFYSKSYPKSLGLEWVNENIFPLIDSFELAIPDVLRTFAAHVATQLAAQFVNGSGILLITGGGVFNQFLISELQKRTNVDIEIPNEDIIESKEALIFALLGLLRIENKINVLASVTGATHDHSSGKIYSDF